MSNEPKVDLAKFLHPSVPNRVYDFWFQHVEHDQNLTLPTQEVFKPWFTKDAGFDLECATQFKPILAAIHQARPELQTQEQVEAQAQQILELVNPESALDWLGLIIFLDQLPRNCYRGEEAALVFSFFDPISRFITLRALEKKIEYSPDVRYRLALRHWFYLPLMHSETLSHQEIMLEKYREMDGDVSRLLDEQPAEGLGEKDLADREILAGNRKAVEAISAQNFKFQKEHYDIIAQFGRYPYRNKVLGRTTTPDEEKFLQEANISFS
ncbi:hypothetical protein ASPVEDRAFT_32027 [Aspergillus versicolor CBS 583.65]|uniref:DUF924-domain-containing protein n=1 Tax=Aspergillus versicolor CBS 583.65 TaxID=1036611 RepID=A0A1L9PVT3_ASPVE|nr:uncharacterized protein ASPVEDRAFT_32027 [Aspergillus versicolor CBS 583.65]OJJ05664.1 hypothetical protein ASPVEDRAFT_32027 [Aspergillus versicolor CBS 583.65]